jgi:hypothetical protein
MSANRWSRCLALVRCARPGIIEGIRGCGSRWGHVMGWGVWVRLGRLSRRWGGGGRRVGVGGGRGWICIMGGVWRSIGRGGGVRRGGRGTECGRGCVCCVGGRSAVGRIGRVGGGGGSGIGMGVRGVLGVRGLKGIRGTVFWRGRKSRGCTRGCGGG